ncbi:MAG: DUF397 domain-containing protein [Acidimicrobiales bacterium]
MDETYETQISAQLVGPWRKSTFSNQGSCVEAAPMSGDRVAVRNSNDHSQGILVLGPTDWRAFLAGCKSCEFDHLTVH